MHRAKVLSSSRLRGRVIEHTNRRRVRIEASWMTSAHQLEGFFFRVLSAETADGSSHQWTRIRSHESDTIELNDAAPGVRAEAAFELTTNEPAPILAARLVTGTAATDALPQMTMRLATTRGTNALLERAGATTAFFVTRGFGDLLLIGDQQRPDLFALDITKRQPLHEHVIEVDERLDAEGNVLRELDEDAVRDAAEQLVSREVTVGAVALLHSYRNSDHEERIAGILRDTGFTHVSCSSELAPLIEILPRAETAVVDAHLSPVIASYLDQVRSAFPDESTGRTETTASSRLHVMTSAGGLVEAGRYHAKDSLLSGPAGGVAGAAAAGRASGFAQLIGFDMGGTSTDVARYDNDFEYRFEHTVGGAKLVAPALAIETVAAGGGSICDYQDDRLRVGPASAGADPGPACYGAGGPLTITDVNLLMGRLAPDQFEIPIDLDAAKAALQRIADTIGSDEAGRDELLDGFLAVANERMADAIAHISLRRGYDVADNALVSFGGAGGQHACALASRLGMKTVIMPRDASLLSAVGLADAVIERFSQRQVLERLDKVREALPEWFNACAEEAISEVRQEGIERDEVTVRRRIVNLRLQGQDATLAIEAESPDQIDNAFAERYADIYGHRPEGKPVEIESIRVVASSKRSGLQPTSQNTSSSTQPAREAASAGTVRARFAGTWQDTPTFIRAELSTGETIRGPALIFDRRSSYVIEPDWHATIDEAGAIIAVAEKQSPSDDALQTGQPEVARLELFTNRFSSIAEEMGQILQRTALSTNVKRRLDFSCGLLDADGRLVVNAPHIPVHLGALGLCVRQAREKVNMRPGDVIVTNHPAYGGSHLPDVTVITPVFDGDDELLGYVASRAHHAEIGGSRPGSMPPMAKTLTEEGVVIPPMYLLKEGESCFDAVEGLLRDAAYPSRSVDDNLADLRAAVAANHRGASSLRALAEQHGRAEIIRRMKQLRERAAKLARQSIRETDDGRYEATEQLDDGSPLSVAITIENDRASIDFTGTAEQHPGNLNATPAIVHSAILYVLRLTIGERLPLNDGILEAVDIQLPKCLLNPIFDDDDATQCPAVVGGNTETSQRLVDTLIKALELAACSQGTMNNVLFGNDNFGYYETVCGGAGAGDGFDGADAVHTHMTNTRITDAEMIEHRYPVRVERFEIRADSGGRGRHRGGHGVTREITFLEPMALSILSQHRVEAPTGLRGGENGACGRQVLVRKGGEELVMTSIDQHEIEPGDRLILHTPGGGGYGRPRTP